MKRETYKNVFSGKLGRWLLASGCYLEVSTLKARGKEFYNRVVSYKEGVVYVMFYNEHYPMKGERFMLNEVDWYQPINPEAFLKRSLNKSLRRHSFLLGVVAHFIVGFVIIKCEKLAKWRIQKK